LLLFVYPVCPGAFSLAHGGLAVLEAGAPGTVKPGQTKMAKTEDDDEISPKKFAH
jgi:hypothetical protein